MKDLRKHLQRWLPLVKSALDVIAAGLKIWGDWL